MIARGLIWYHWQVYLEKNYAVQTHSVTNSVSVFSTSTCLSSTLGIVFEGVWEMVPSSTREPKLLTILE